jgi:sporulation protein YlmC with PRC-barrel domain
MAEGHSSLIESDRIEGTRVYSSEGTEIGAIKRLIIDKATGRIVYVVVSFVSSVVLSDVPYVFPWAKLFYDKNSGGYRTEMTDAELSNAPAAAQGEVDWGDPEAVEGLEAIFRIPPAWRSV